MNRVRPENLARQDQALALLRDRYPFSLSTGEIAREVWVVEHGHWQPACDFEKRDGYRVRTHRQTGCWTHCPKVWVPYPNQPKPDSVMTRTALKRLERAGLVERVDRSDLGMRHTYWRATDLREERDE